LEGRMMRWAMVIDLRQCIGCKSCSVICSQGNGVPQSSWRRVIDCGVPEYAHRERLFVPVHCNHCERPPCLEVCPTGATTRSREGIVTIDQSLCLGCGYCVLACPYQARVIIDREFHLPPGAVRRNRPEDYLGVCTKCSFCSERVDAGLARGLQPGRDPEATPFCVTTCTAGALHFGDIDDEEGEVATLVRENRTAVLQQEFGTGPAVYYLVPEWWRDFPAKAAGGRVEDR
jgi:phenylacetyl-CoA:acceptor oxidoreductase 27-kDa subunit